MPLAGEPTEIELAKVEIRVVNVEEIDGGFDIRVGRGR